MNEYNVGDFVEIAFMDVSRNGYKKYLITQAHILWKDENCYVIKELPNEEIKRLVHVAYFDLIKSIKRLRKLTCAKQ